MATFKAKCPQCNQGFEAEEEWIGAKGECPGCGSKILIEKGATAPITYNLNIKAATGLRIARSTEAEQEPSNTSTTGEKACPFCGEGIKSNAVRCKHCQSSLSPLLEAAPAKNYRPLFMLGCLVFFIIGLAVIILGVKMLDNYREQVKKATIDLFAAAQSDDLSLASAAIDKGADVNMKIQNDITPIFAAVTHGSYRVLNLLIQKGADVNARDMNNIPVIMYAVTRGDMMMVNFLISKGANPKLDN